MESSPINYLLKTSYPYFIARQTYSPEKYLESKQLRYRVKPASRLGSERVPIAEASAPAKGPRMCTVRARSWQPIFLVEKFN